jgi:ribosomal protein L27
MVANDSLYEDTEGTYVYVRKESGEKTRRNIQIGEQDDHETEVVSGLSEGELVYYESDTRMPADYTTYAVTRSDFSITKSMDSYVCSDTKLSLYQADEEGIITTLAVKSDQQVKKGDLLYIIDTGVGRAAMTEAKRQIDQENRSYESTIKSYGAGESYEKQLAKLTHEYTLSQLTAAYEAVTKNNDGYGNVSVYANADGTIAACRIEEGDQVSKGDTLFDISTPATNKLVVKVDENELAPIGKEITVRKGKKSYTGHCIGWGNGTEAEKTFYVTMDDASSYENVSDGQMTYSTVSVKDVIVLPTSMIHQEGEDSFVWKWEGDELIKQYVQVSDSLTDRSQTVVLTGVDAADVLVIE